MPLRSPKPQWTKPWVIATSTCATGYDTHGVSMPVRLVAGTAWASDDELVRQRSWLFADAEEIPPALIMRTTPPPIEHIA